MCLWLFLFQFYLFQWRFLFVQRERGIVCLPSSNPLSRVGLCFSACLSDIPACLYVSVYMASFSGFLKREEETAMKNAISIYTFSSGEDGLASYGWLCVMGFILCFKISSICCCLYTRLGEYLDELLWEKLWKTGNYERDSELEWSVWGTRKRSQIKAKKLCNRNSALLLWGKLLRGSWYFR